MRAVVGPVDPQARENLARRRQRTGSDQVEPARDLPEDDDDGQRQCGGVAAGAVHAAPRRRLALAEKRTTSSVRAWKAASRKIVVGRGRAERNVDDADDPARPAAENDDAIGEEDRLVDAVGDEQRRRPLLHPDALQFDDSSAGGGSGRARRTARP